MVSKKFFHFNSRLVGVDHAAQLRKKKGLNFTSVSCKTRWSWTVLAYDCVMSSPYWVYHFTSSSVKRSNRMLVHVSFKFHASENKLKSEKWKVSSFSPNFKILLKIQCTTSLHMSTHTDLVLLTSSNNIHNARALTPMNTRMQTLPLWDELSYHKCLAVDGLLTSRPQAVSRCAALLHVQEKSHPV